MHLVFDSDLILDDLDDRLICRAHSSVIRQLEKSASAPTLPMPQLPTVPSIVTFTVKS